MKMLRKASHGHQCDCSSPHVAQSECVSNKVQRAREKRQWQKEEATDAE